MRRYFLNENFKGVLRLDAREKRDIATGADLKYKIPNYGGGLLKLYYMNERKITAKRWYKERPTPTIERERFKSAILLNSLLFIAGFHKFWDADTVQEA